LLGTDHRAPVRYANDAVRISSATPSGALRVRIYPVPCEQHSERKFSPVRAFAIYITPDFVRLFGLVNGKDVRGQNTDVRIQISPGPGPRILDSDICILTSDIFAV
jgi:hypothetical protein